MAADGIATREFVNEFGNKIAIFVRDGGKGQNVMSRVQMTGPNSTTCNKMTHDELVQLCNAIHEALGRNGDAP